MKRYLACWLMRVRQAVRGKQWEEEEEEEEEEQREGEAV